MASTEGEGVLSLQLKIKDSSFKILSYTIDAHWCARIFLEEGGGPKLWSDLEGVLVVIKV